MLSVTQLLVCRVSDLWGVVQCFGSLGCGFKVSDLWGVVSMLRISGVWFQYFRSLGCGFNVSDLWGAVSMFRISGVEFSSIRISGVWFQCFGCLGCMGCLVNCKKRCAKIRRKYATLNLVTPLGVYPRLGTSEGSR